MKRITPDSATLKKWARILPPGKDQIFLPRAFSPSAAHGLPLEKLLPGKPRKHWGLLERSWFGYLASQAAYRIVLPAEKLANLPAAQREALKKIQIKIKNPALVPSRLLPASIREPGPYTWLSAGLLRQLRAEEKIAALKAWDQAGKFTGVYLRVSPSSLPAGPKGILRRQRLLKLVNTFAAASGPNCFAAAAYAMTGRHLYEWMHAPDFLKAARRAGFSPAEGKPLPGDVLVCRQKGEPMHAALYLGGFVFEKPGQDLYEPYRLVRWKNWQRDWSHARFECWRKYP